MTAGRITSRWSCPFFASTGLRPPFIYAPAWWEGARPLRRALQRYVEDPLSEALIAGQIAARPAFLEVYLDANQLFYRPVSADETASEEKAAGILLYSA